jgi:magnesium-transporting ATPase (P-type)
LTNRDQQSPAWHTLLVEDALRALASEPEGGLSTTEAAARLARYGPNELPETAGRGIARMVHDQFSDFMILVLIAAAIVSGLVGELADTIAILVIVLLNAAIGVAQESGLALAAERAERDIMRRPPRRPEESIFAHGMWQHMLWVGLLMGAVCLILQAWSIQRIGTPWQTMVFTVLCLSQLGHVMAIRSERDSLFHIGVASNRPLLAAVVGAVALQLATVYTPALNSIFKTEPLDWDELAICLALSTLVFFAVEAEKWLLRRGLFYADGPARLRESD